MSAPPFMKLYIAEYLADTTHLSRGEHGAYLLLIMAMWRGGGKLPYNHVKLAKISKATPEEWPEIWASIGDLFKVRGGTITQARVRKERAVYDNVVRNASEAGKASAAKRTKENNELGSTKRQRKPNQIEEEAEGYNSPPKGAIITGPDGPRVESALAPSPREVIPLEDRRAMAEAAKTALGIKPRGRRA